MNLSTRLNRLEAKRKAIWCLWCRHNLRTTHRPAGAPIADHIEAKCWFCGNKYIIPTVGCCANLKEAISLTVTSHPIKLFTDERVHTAKLWIDVFRFLPLRPYYEGKAETPPTRELSKTRQARKEAAEAFHKRQMEQFKLKANGPESFPIDATLALIENERKSSSIPADVPATCQLEAKKVVKDIDRFMHILKSAAACELVLWGEVLPETQTEIRFFEQEQSGRIAVIIERAAENERERAKTTEPIAKPVPIAAATSSSSEPQPPHIVSPVIEVSPSDLLARANGIELPMEEEETGLQRVVRLAEEEREREYRREIERGRVPVTLPTFG